MTKLFTSGCRHRRIQFKLAGIGLVLVLVLVTHASAIELAEVLERTAVTPPAEVAFREERHNPMLKEPLVLTGTLNYLAVGVMKKSIESPFVESYLIDGDRIVIERQGKTRSLALSRSRSLHAVMTAIEAVLAGRSDKLDALFSVELFGEKKSWTLRLTPSSKKLAKHIEGLQIDGNDTAVTGITVSLRGEEWQRMEILDSIPES